jgi:hypothetical protein
MLSFVASILLTGLKFFAFYLTSSKRHSQRCAGIDH